ncbi:MAG: hypothetical protein CMJ48_00955, partial [Planctomycetaceae bacterium]|nr:hypothetical protein [Planctomycetaceae bacterium]
DQPVAVLELREPAGQPMGDVKIGVDLEISDPVELEISGCFVRGDADLIVLEQAAPSDCAISNSVIALRGRLLHVLGTKNQLPDGARNRLQMNHVTCLLGGSLIDVDTGDLPRQVNPIHVRSARNNIFAVDRESGQPLVKMEGNTNTEDFRDLLMWAEGERNFYDEIDEFWRIQSLPEAFFEPETLDFSAWKQHWQTDEVRAYNGSIEWAVDWRNEPLGQLTASDVALDGEALANPAIAGAADMSDAGANLETPQFPRRLSTIEQ